MDSSQSLERIQVQTVAMDSQENRRLDLTSQTPNTNGDNRPLVTCTARLWEKAQMCDTVLGSIANHKEAW